VYARLTGFGQDGPYAGMAGHDINYIAISGALSLLGRKGEKPLPPVNLLGDFAGGGMLCALGVCLALLERGHSGRGQVVDAAMVDGAAYLSTFVYKFRNAGMWRDERGTNMLTPARPSTTRIAPRTGQFMSVGAIEPQFYAALLRGLGLDAVAMPAQMEQASWAATAARFADLFAQKTRDEWSAIFDGTDACVAPVLGLGEAHEHPHNRARSLLIADHQDKREPAPAPRLSRTPGDGTRPPPGGDHTRDVLGEFWIRPRRDRPSGRQRAVA
jgi:alpha-methylacyl-CoA racemase